MFERRPANAGRLIFALFTPGVAHHAGAIRPRLGDDSSAHPVCGPCALSSRCRVVASARPADRINDRGITMF